MIAAERLRTRGVSGDHSVKDLDVFAENGLRQLRAASQPLTHNAA